MLDENFRAVVFNNIRKGPGENYFNPNVAKMCRGKTRQGAPDVASHSLRKVEAYLTVREILPETSKGADGVAWREFSGFGRQQVCNVRVNSTYVFAEHGDYDYLKQESIYNHNVDIKGQRGFEKDDFNYALDFESIYRTVHGKRTVTRIE